MTAIKVNPAPPAQAALIRLLTSTDPDLRAQGEELALADPSLMPEGMAWVELRYIDGLVEAASRLEHKIAWRDVFDSGSQSWLDGRIKMERSQRGKARWALRGNLRGNDHLGGNLWLSHTPQLMARPGERLLVKRVAPFAAQADYGAPEGLDLWEVWIAERAVPAPPPWAWRVIVGRP